MKRKPFIGTQDEIYACIAVLVRWYSYQQSEVRESQEMIEALKAYQAEENVVPREAFNEPLLCEGEEPTKESDS